MLLEDDTRGTSVECLLCKGSIRVDASASGSQVVAGGAAQPGAGQLHAAKPQAAAEAIKPTVQQKVVNCANAACNTPLKVPPHAKAIKCPKCGNVFNV